jgi:hypothetical protein
LCHQTSYPNAMEVAYLDQATMQLPS